MTDEYLTQHETAAALRLSEQTLWRMRRSGTGPPAYRVGHGKRILYRRSEVADYLARAKVAARVAR
jgi:predicted DNA-binding transcriptional regulator AlpA